MNICQKKAKIIPLVVILSLSNHACLSFSWHTTRQGEKLFDKGTIKKSDANSLAFLLAKAVNDGDLTRIQELIELGVDVNKPYAFDVTACPPLVKAIGKGQSNVVRCLVEHGADVNIEYNFAGIKTTPLYMAASHTYFEMVQYLVEHGADVNAVFEASYSKERIMLLYQMAARGDMRMVQYLVEHGADVDAVSFFTFHHETALCAAISRGRIDVAHYLVEHGASVEAQHDDNSPLAVAICYKNVPLIKYLIACGAHVNAVSLSGDPILFKAVDSDSLEIVELLVQAGADANKTDRFGAFILDLTDSEEIKAYLLSKGAHSAYEA